MAAADEVDWDNVAGKTSRGQEGGGRDVNIDDDDQRRKDLLRFRIDAICWNSLSPFIIVYSFDNKGHCLQHSLSMFYRFIDSSPTLEEIENQELEEEGECLFCLLMNGGMYKEVFINWEICIAEGQ
ncbi:hypothetical protein L2E82_20371 [Cichorium intybus]|uniref:Uncharacterized protein n=1 Tax=Cichorium intybus TaxID=13427 RepID=A0ACB9DTK2_CICIN|nr:hypothetical protein L2E82_20371 [Cichorium intybus]